MLLLSACNSNQTPLERRQAKAKEADDKNSNKIIIGITWPRDESKAVDLVTGVRFAVEEWHNQCVLNNDKAELCDFLQNKEIELKEEDESIDDEGMSDSERYRLEQNNTHRIARKFANNLNIIAVIGHRKSAQAISASITYEQQGIVFLAPTATNLALTNHNFKYVFRLMPNNDELSVKMADYFKNNNYKRVAILYERNVYAEEFAETFMKNSTNKVDIVFQQSFFQKEEDFTEILGNLKKKSFLLDAIFLVTDDEKACKIIEQADDLDIDKPFAGGDAVFGSQLESCPKARETVVPTIIDESRLNAFKKDLEKSLELKYGKKINVESISNTEYQKALLGDDAINLLVHVINQIKSTKPIEIANKLRYMNPWEGKLGEYAFENDGNLKRDNAINLAILCPKPEDPQKLFFKISSDLSPKCDINNSMITPAGNQ
jgi:ABC-type branched-subunit amino acid transport system substrate-binding protein